MADLSGGNAFIDVMPSMRGYFTRVRSEITSNPVEHQIEPTVNQAALNKARQQVEQMSAKVEAARRKEADAVGSVRVAEAQLNDVRNKANATDAQRVRAQENYERAVRNAEAAVRELRNREADMSGAQNRLVRVEARFDAGDSEAQARSWSDRMREHADNAGAAFARGRDRANAFADKVSGVSMMAAGALGAMGTMSFKLASDWEQALGAMETVFGNQSGLMTRFAEDAARTVGLAKTEYAELANVMGAMLRNMGIPMDQIGGKTNDLITLGADLAATYGGTTREAVEALSSALRGETDPIERYGISIKQSTIDAEMAKRGLGELEGEAKKLAQAETLLSLITEQSGGAIGAFSREGDTAANKIQVAKAEVSNLATEFGEALLPIVGDVAKSLSGLVGFLGENKWAAYLFVGVLGALAAAFVVAKIAAIGFGIANAIAMAPITFTIGLIVLAIAALVAAFVWLWKNNEGFRDGIKAIWEAIKGFFVAAWEVIKGVFQWIGDAAVWLWQNVLSPVFEVIKIGFAIVAAAFVLGWQIIQGIFNIFAAVANWLWTNVLSPVFEVIKAGFRFVGDAFTWVWERVIRPAWDALGNGIRWVIDKVIDPAFGFLRDILDRVGRSFETVTGWIGQVWDRVKGIAAKPVRFIVETVYNKGIVAAWNKVAGWLHIDKLQEADLGQLGAYAKGGVLPGYTPGRDVYDFYTASGLHIKLGGGEAILRPEVTRALGPDKIDRLNATAAVGGPAAVARELGQYAGGGVVGSIIDKVNRFFPGMSITSTTRNTNDLHGRGLAVDFSNGYDTTPQMQEAARFFYRNYGSMLAELIHYPLNGWQNIDEGRPFDFGASTNSQHRNHVHVAAYDPLPEPGSPITPIKSGGGGFMGWLRDRVGDAFNAIMNPIGNAIPNFGDGAFGKLPRQAFDKFKTSVHSFLVGKADEEDSKGYGDPGGASVERWRPLVSELLDYYGHPASWADLTLRRMNQESGGNPRAINNWDINARNGTPSKGLMQVIDPTFRSYRDSAFINDIWDPRANIAASMRYATATYGSLPAAYNRAGGYDQGGLASGTGIMLKRIIHPERVLNSRQTAAFESMLPLLERMAPGTGVDPREFELARGGTEFVAQKIENQWVVDPQANQREVRRASKRALAGSGVQL